MKESLIGTPELREAALAMVHTVVRPRKTFEVLRARPYWVLLFTVLSLASIALGAWMKPYNIRAAATALPQDMPADEQQEMFVKWEKAQRTGMMMVPVLLLVKIGFGALFIWLLSIAFDRSKKFSFAVAVIAHATVIAMLEAYAAFATFAWRGLDAIRTPFDLQPALGLNALIATRSVPLTAFLGGINPFAVWYVAVLTIGIAAVFEMQKRKAVVIAGGYWALTVAFQVGIAAIAAAVAGAS